MYRRVCGGAEMQQMYPAAVAAHLSVQSDACLRSTPGLQHSADTFVLHWYGGAGTLSLHHLDLSNCRLHTFQQA